MFIFFLFMKYLLLLLYIYLLNNRFKDFFFYRSLYTVLYYQLSILCQLDIKYNINMINMYSVYRTVTILLLYCRCQTIVGMCTVQISA